MLRGLVAVAAAALTAAGAAGPPDFGPRTLVATANPGGALQELEAGDVTGDGRPDVVVARLQFQSHATFPLGVFSQSGGVWRDVTGELFRGEPPRTQHPRQILIADFNGDGRNDVFVADHGYDAEPFPGFHPSLALSTTDGKLVDATSTLPDVSGFNHSACAGDIDRDGDVDVYVGALGGKGPLFLVNNGRAEFTLDRSRLPAGYVGNDGTAGTVPWYVRCLLADVTGDRAVDLVLGVDQNTARSHVLVNDGSGRFTRAIPLPPKPLGDNVIAIALATIDLDHDGSLDLLVGHTRGDPFYVGRWIQVLANDGHGFFTDQTERRLPQTANSARWPIALRVADVDGDGDEDFGVAFPAGSPEQPLFYENRDGTFAPAVELAAPALFTFLDANGDGRPDVFAGEPGERHYVLEQRAVAASPPPPPPPPAPPPPPSPPPPVAPKRPAPPTGVRAKAFARGIRITWKPSAGASVYQVLRDRRQLAWVSATRYDDRTARRGVRYSYRVVAASDAGISAPSAPVRASRP